MSVTVDGVFSGLDTTGIINALIGVQAGNRNIMQDQLEQERLRLGAVSELNSRLQSLADAAQTLRETAEEGFSATVPEDAGFTADAGSGAVGGTYNVSVTSLASSEMEVSQGLASKTSAVLSTGTLDLTIGGVTTSLTVDATNNNLTDLAAAINEIDGLQSYVLDAGGSTPYQLVIQSEETGADNAVTIDTTGLSGGTDLSFTEAQAASDASLTVNGQAITSSSNAVTAIPGLTIDLQQAGLGSSTILVQVDQTTLEEQLDAFVEAYNSVTTFYSNNTNFNQETGRGGPLFGDATARRTVGRLGDMISAGYSTSSSLTILAQVGLETRQSGGLNFDSSVLADAIEDGFDEVIDFLTDDAGAMASLVTEIEDVFVDPLEGTLKTRQDSLERSIRDLEDRIADEDQRLDDQAALLRQRFSALESTLAELQGTTQFISNLFPAPTN